jgi:DNA-binding NtrC family response regulator
MGAGGGKAAENSLASTEDLNLDALEQRCITAALARAAGNRTVAAELLGISRRTLQRKLKEKGLQ